MRKVAVQAVCFCSLLLVVGGAGADEAPAEPDQAEATTVEGWLANSEPYFSLGDYVADETLGELESPHADFGLGLGIKYPYSKHISIHYDMLAVESQYDTPAGISGGLFTVVNEEMTLTTLGFSVIPVVNYSSHGFQVYAGAGLGLFFSTLRLTASTLGLPGEHEEKASDFGTQVVLGMGYQSGNTYMGLEFRKLNLDASFEPVTGPSDFSIGGEMSLLIFRFSL